MDYYVGIGLTGQSRKYLKSKIQNTFELIKQYDYELQADKLESILMQIDDFASFRYTKLDFKMLRHKNKFGISLVKFTLSNNELQIILEHIIDTN